MKALGKILRGTFGVVVFLPAILLYLIGASVGVLFALLFLGFGDGSSKIAKRF